MSETPQDHLAVHRLRTAITTGHLAREPTRTRRTTCTSGLRNGLITSDTVLGGGRWSAVLLAAKEAADA